MTFQNAWKLLVQENQRKRETAHGCHRGEFLLVAWIRGVGLGYGSGSHTSKEPLTHQGTSTKARASNSKAESSDSDEPNELLEQSLPNLVEIGIHHQFYTCDFRKHVLESSYKTLSLTECTLYTNDLIFTSRKKTTETPTDV